MTGARGEDEIIVREIELTRLDLFGRNIHGLHLGKDYLHVAAFAQDAANRSGDVGRRQRCSCDLVQQRLEEVMIGPVNDRHLDLFTGELLGGFESAEACPDDNYPRPSSRSVFHRANFPRVAADASILLVNQVGAKPVVTCRRCAILRALCQSRLPAAKRAKPFRSVSRLPPRAKSCVSMPPAAICSRPRVPNANGSWPNPRWSTRPTKPGSRPTCRSHRAANLSFGRATLCGAATWTSRQTVTPPQKPIARPRSFGNSLVPS